MVLRTLATHVLAFAALGVAAAASASDVAAGFLGRYCGECHSGRTPEAGLTLDAATAENMSSLINAAARQGPLGLRRWERVHDRIAAGEMPPAEAEQPSSAERAQAVAWLRGSLQAASGERQRQEGRAGMRRLNRAEYEFMLHDLLGVGTAVARLLPEDSLADGFDTVASGLTTSATHLLRFQQAAALALADALPTGQVVEPATVRWTGREWLAQRDPTNRDYILKHARVENDAIVFHAMPNSHNCVFTSFTPLAGRYRIRARLRSINAPQPVPVQVARLHVDRFAREKLRHVLTWTDAPAAGRELDIEALLPAGEQVVLEATTPLAKDGPHLAIEWIELSGPLDGGTGWRRLYGGLPRVPNDYLEAALAGTPVTDEWKRWHPGELKKPEHRLRLVSRDPRADAERLVRDFLPRAMRRPPTAAVADAFVADAHARLERGATLEEALTDVFVAVLSSPHVFLVGGPPGPLDGHSLAERLALFLWSSAPDDALLQAAADGSLLSSEGLTAQTDRLLADRRSSRFIDRFTGMWLDLRLMHDMKPDARYVEYDDLLAWSMPEETRRFFAAVLRDDLPATSFFHADWSMLNGRLATHYGVSGVAGVEFQRVSLPPDAHRGGVITQAAVLKLTTNATSTSPVKRGAWVLDRLLGTPPAPPPPDVAAIEPDIRGAVTIREQLAKHQAVASCAACHRHIDPPGFALETFDVVGGWRTRYRGPEGGGEGLERVELAALPGRQVWVGAAVEPAASLPGGESFDSIDGYKSLVLRTPELLVRNLAAKLVVYGTGSEIEFADRQTLDDIVASVRDTNYGFRSLVHAVVQSPLFRHR